MINKDKAEGHFLFSNRYKLESDDTHRSLYKVMLSANLSPSKLNTGNIYFIHPFAYVPNKIAKVECNCLLFDFNYLHQHTEHKELLFKSPYITGDTSFINISLPKLIWKEIHLIFSQIVKELTSRDSHSDKIIISYLNIIFAMCDRMNSGIKTAQPKHHYTNLLIVSKFRQLLFSHHLKYRSVEYYAKELYLTPNYLNEVLKSVTGKNASTIINEFVILESKYLLLHTILSSKEVAEDLGFSSQTYFTRFFKKNVGLTPMEWFNAQVFD